MILPLTFSFHGFCCCLGTEVFLISLNLMWCQATGVHSNIHASPDKDHIGHVLTFRNNIVSNVIDSKNAQSANQSFTYPLLVKIKTSVCH